MNDRSVEKVLQAAASIDIRHDPHYNARPAAIVGGIVRSVLDKGRFDESYVAHAAGAILDWGYRTARDDYGMQRASVMFPDITRPKRDEIADMVRRFKDAYEPPKAAA